MSSFLYKIKNLIKSPVKTEFQQIQVSIVTPSYNQGQFIEGTLISVNEQDYPNIEHLIIDAGSTDETLEVLKKWEDSISYVTEPDKGQSDAVNKGIRKAQGDIIGWLNSDDYYTSTDVISIVVKFFNDNLDAEVVYGRGEFVGKDGEVLKETYVHKDDSNLLFSFAWSVGILQPAVFFKRSVFDKVGFLNVDNHFCMDYEFWVRMTHAGIKMHFLNKKLAKARFYDDMKSSKGRGKQLECIMETVKKHYGFVHPRWIKVYANHQVSKDVQIISPDRRSDKDKELVEQIEKLQKETFLKYNSSDDALKALKNSAYCDKKIAAEYIDKYLKV